MEAKLKRKRVKDFVSNNAFNLVYHLTGLQGERQAFFKSVYFVTKCKVPSWNQHA